MLTSQTYVPERRFPLELSSAMPEVWELWQRAKTLEWDPQTDIPWEELHPERYSAEQFVAAEEILIDVFKATVHKATNPAVRRLMELILRDEVRHIAFGWQCLDAWAPSFTPETVRNIEAAVTTMIEQVEFRGYRNLWLAIEGGSATPAEIEADRISCEAALGGSTPEDETQVFPAFAAK